MLESGRPGDRNPDDRNPELVLDDTLVVNAVGHAYNLAADNPAGPTGEMVREGLYGLYSIWNPPDIQVPKEVWQTNQSMDDLAAVNFVESDVDVVVWHTLRLDSLFKDGLCSHAKALEAAERWPRRFLFYAGVDPTQGLDACIADLERQVAELPSVIGLKMYPDQVEPYRTWRMDDPALAFPLYERAQELGVRSIAVHKALPNGPVPLNPYRVDDLEGAAMAFPGLNFEIVHAGMAFVEETAYAIARFPNVYASLEVTTLLMHRAPGMWEDVLGTFLFWGGPEKILWSDGSLFCHPQPLLEKFRDFAFSQRALEKFGFEPLGPAEKQLILGGNYVRMMGLDPAALRQGVAGDEFAQAQAGDGKPAPWSTWMAGAGAR